MLPALRPLLTIRHALSLAALVAAVAAGAFFLLRAEATLDLSVTPADLTVFGDDASDFSGSAVATGDINGDTVDDVIITAPSADPLGGATAGETYVIFGGGGLPASIDLDISSADLTVFGDDASDRSGAAVAAGDINGDTFDDLIIGVPEGDPAGGTSAGEIYVIFGDGSLPPTIDLDSTSADLTIFGDDAFDDFGSSVAAGDINGDTVDDLIVGAVSADPVGGSSAGETYVIYGSGSLPATIDLNTTSADLVVFGDDPSDDSGFSVAAGDINGDTTDDLIIGAWLADPPGGSRAGETYVIYGDGSLPATIDLDTTSADLTVFGDNQGDRSGTSVAAGDINGDTMDDLIIGASGADPAGNTGAGEVYVIYGGASLPTTIDLDSVSADVTARGSFAGDGAGVDVAAGDIDGDTTDDLIIGASGADASGKTFVIYGSGALATTIDLADGIAGLIVAGADTNDSSGGAVAAGDIDGDTVDDLVIGARGGDPSGGGGAGETYVVFGGPQVTPKPTPTSTPTSTATPTATPTRTGTPTPCGFPIATCTPTVTPTKLAIDGSLSGVFDVLVHDGTKTDQHFYCKARIDHDTSLVDAGGGEVLKTAATCYLDSPGQGDPDSAVPTDPNIDLGGPPPPPPYGSDGPVKGNGSYCPTSSGGCTDVLGNPMPEDRAVVVTCFPSQGAILGPNVIWVTTVDNVKVDVANQSGTVDIHYAQGILECDSKAPKGPPTLSFSINLTRYDQEPYDNITSVDSDGDGCADAFELDKRRLKKDCGDDPWNPHDSDLNFTGSYSIIIEVERADTCHGGQPFGRPPVGCDPPAVDQDIAAGSYYHCQAFLDHDKGDDSVTGKAFCYTDNTVTTVNFEANGGHAQCAPFGTGLSQMCGDGLAGVGPPVIACKIINCLPSGENQTNRANKLADNDGTPGDITGVLDKANNRLILDVCFSGVDHPLEGPNLYMRLDVDAASGLGSADVWLMRGSCDKPLPGDTPTAKDAPVSIGEQNDVNCSFVTLHPTCYDIDLDGCSARQELGTNEFQGGQRDPFNKFDHMDINKDGTINVADDIIGTAALFGPVPPNTQGDVSSRMAGSVPWAKGSGDNVVNIADDIFGVAAQFGHNCE